MEDDFLVSLKNLAAMTACPPCKIPSPSSIATSGATPTLQRLISINHWAQWLIIRREWVPGINNNNCVLRLPFLRLEPVEH